MGDTCETKMVSVTIQQNGIIRALGGRLIARLDRDIGYDHGCLRERDAEIAALKAEVKRLRVVVDGLHVERDDYACLYQDKVRETNKLKRRAKIEVLKGAQDLVRVPDTWTKDQPEAYHVLANMLKQLEVE